MNRTLLALLILLSFAFVAKGQGGNTSITALVLDPNNVPYTSSTVNIVFFDPGTSGKLPLLNGSTFQTQYTGFATDSFGNLPPISLPDNGIIASGSGATDTKWTIRITYSDRQTSFFVTTPINCAANIPNTCTNNTIDISALLHAAAAVIPPQGGGGCGPGGLVNSLQKKANNGGCAASSITDDGTTVNVGDNTHFKGLNPYVDVTSPQFGVRSCLSGNIPCASGITAATNGTTSVTLSTSNCPAQAVTACFVTGDGVIIYGAGAAHSMTTPSAPTVTPSVARVLTGLHDVTNGPTGATSYSYQVFAEDKAGGITAASTATNIANGASSLGAQSVSLSSCSRANDIVTCTTSSAHGLKVGAVGPGTAQMVIVQGTTDSSFSGWWSTSNVADTTHFSYASSLDTRNGASASTTGGTLFWFQSNHITWTAVAGAYRYWIVGRTAGSMATIGYSWPRAASGNAGQLGDLVWDDWGSPMVDNVQLPAWIPSTPPGSATNDSLSTTIVSGAGTTNLVLANAAGATLPSASIFLDAVPGIKAAVTFATTTLNRAAPIYFPSITTGNIYLIASFLDLSGTQRLRLQFGGVPQLNNTVQLAQWTSLEGGPIGSVGSTSSFSYKSLIPVVVNAAYPGFHFIQGGATYMQGLSLVGQSTNQNLLVVQDLGAASAGSTYKQVEFQSLQATDYLGIMLLGRGDTNTAPPLVGAAMNLEEVLSIPSQFNSGPAINTATPGIACNDCDVLNIRSLTMSHRGVYFGSPNVGNSNVDIRGAYYQVGSIGTTPFLMASAANTGGGVATNIGFSGSIVLDTSPHPLLAIFSGNGSPSYTVNDFTKAFASVPSVPAYTGVRPVAVNGRASQNSSGGAAIASGLNREVSGFFDTAQALDGIYNTTNIGPVGILYSDGYQAVGPNYGVFVDSIPMAAPSGVVAGGGSVPVGLHTYQVTPIWQNGGSGILSPASAGVTTSPGNQTVNLSWTPVPGPCKGYQVWRDGVMLTNFAPTVTPCTANSFSDTIAIPNGASPVLQPSGGPTMLMPGQQGIATPAITMGSTVFANLGIPVNGTFLYCPDCTIANPCAGGGTGALAKRLNGVWVCN